MCGIVGYVGERPATKTLLDALGKLEYRGYDSSGVAVLTGHGIAVRKHAGKLSTLAGSLQKRPIAGTVGMGHNRWATHGIPSERNAHPHTDCSKRFAVVHNGIIENYVRLKKSLQRKGHRFSSQTDTEVIVHLIEEEAKHASVRTAFRRAVSKLRGSYAICMVAEDVPDTVFGARMGSPLIIGVGKREMFFASDVPAVLDRTREILYINDGEWAMVTGTGAVLFDGRGKHVHRKPVRIPWDLAATQKGGFAHFMRKEIHEQPEAVAHTLLGRLDRIHSRIQLDPSVERILKHLCKNQRLVIVSCGTAAHAGMVGGYLFERLACTPTRVEVGSEFRYRDPILDSKTILIAISQSGETADTLAAVRLAKGRGAKVLAICNVVGAAITREADATMYTHAGPEIAVASTKAYSCQLAVLGMLALAAGNMRQKIPAAQWRMLLRELARLPLLIRRTLGQEKVIRAIAKRYARARNFYFLGRRLQYPSAREGALKLTEICPVIHAEGFAAGEMKHGPIAVIRKGWPSVFLATASPILEKVLSNMEEIKARHGDIIAIVSKGEKQVSLLADAVIEVPKTDPIFAPIVSAVPLQLLAYHIAKENGCDIDQPPNLAKSVTVE